MTITLERANELIARAIADATRQGVRVAAVVIDAGGHIVSAQRMDGAYLTALTIAERKAFTAVNFRMSTVAMRERLAQTDYQIQIQVTDPRLAFLPGGVPIRSGDAVIGGLGISGGTGAQDVQIAEAALVTPGSGDPSATAGPR